MDARMRSLLSVILLVAAEVCSASGPAEAPAPDPRLLKENDPAWLIQRTGNAFYEVAVNDLTGAYGARTGPLHPVTTKLGEPARVLRHGVGFTTGIVFNSLRSYSSRTDYRLGPLPRILEPSPGFGCLTALDLGPPRSEPIEGPSGPVGVRLTWEVDRPPDRFDLVQDVLARGDTFTGSAVQVTMTVRNRSDEALRIGAAFFWDFALGNSGASAGPVVGPKPPEPPDEPFVLLERRFEPPRFRSYVLSNEEYPSSPGPTDDNLYVVEGTIGDVPIDPPPVRPGRFQQTQIGWSFDPPAPEGLGPFNSCFDFTIPDPPREAFKKSGGLYQWGPTEQTAISVPPGAAWSATQYIFAYLEFPLACDAGGPYAGECRGPVTEIGLDGSRSANLEGEALSFRWTTSDPAVRLRDPTSVTPVAEVSSLGPHPVDLLVHNGPYATGCAAQVEVVDTTPPEVLRAAAQPAILWPPNHRMVPVEVSIEAEDLCEGAPRVRLVEVRSSEADEASGVGDGRTAGDVQEAEIGADDRSVLLRAERDGTGPGRTYTLVYEVSDSSGNAVRLPIEVSVSHDRRVR